jgi:hypothetical protein
MKRALAASAFALASSITATPAAAGAPVLQVTLTAPASVRVDTPDTYSISVRNVGTAAADGTIARLPLNGMTVASMPSWCSVVQQSPNGQLPAVQLVACNLSRVGVGGTKSVDVVLKSPLAPTTLTRRAYADPSNAAAFASAPVIQQVVAAFSIPIAPPRTLAGWACYGTTPIPNAICPDGSKINGDLQLLPGHVVDAPGSGQTWTQPTPSTLEIVFVEGTFMATWSLTAVSPTCFRGPAVNNGPYSQGAVTMCLQ